MEQTNSKNQIKNNSAKYAFFYMLTLVALAFLAISVGIIVFQIINKNIADVIATYRTCYSSGALKFAISAIIISAPIYYIISWLINKSLFSGILDKESGIRRWLTYFILFISSVVIIGNLISIIYSFLDGELTTKFILKALTLLIISAAIFSYYLYDIRRENIEGNSDKVIKIYFIISLLVVVAALISGFVFVESPMEARIRKQDGEILQRFNNIKYAIESFNAEHERLPKNLDELTGSPNNLRKAEMENPVDGKVFDYKVISDDKYELCANFQTSNIADDEVKDCYAWYSWLDEEWEHDKGYQCLESEVFKYEKDDLGLEPAVPTKLEDTENEDIEND